MKNIGQFLKTERENLGFSLEEVAERTKIHLSTLASIEAGDRDALPAKVFCIGLIKSYARELKVDMAKMDQLCAQAFAEPVKEEVPAPTPQKIEKEDADTPQAVGLFQFPKIVGWLASLVVIVALIGVIYAVVNKLNSYSEEEALPVEVFETAEVNGANEEPNLVQGEEATVNVGEESKTETSEKSGEEKSSATQTEKVAEKKQKPVEAKKEPKEEAAPQKQEPKVVAPEPAPQKVDETPAVAETQEPEFTDDNNFETEATESAAATVVSDNKLIITALEPIRAEVVWSDGYVQVMLLKSQETKTLVFSSPIKLRLNNGGAVQVSFNDGGSKVPGTFNQPIELSYP